MKKKFSAQECKSALNAIADCIEQQGSFFTREELRELLLSSLDDELSEEARTKSILDDIPFIAIGNGEANSFIESLK
jgi:hypothetical protein